MNNRNYRYDVRCVHASAKGHWGLIFQSLAPALQEAMKRPGKHCPCPVHGGKDAFRLFPNYAENGACVCNTCGGKRDGLATLCWVNHWDFKTALSKVATVLGIQPAGESSSNQLASQRRMVALVTRNYLLDKSIKESSYLFSKTLMKCA